MSPPVIVETAVAVMSSEVAHPAEEELKAENQRKDEEIKELEERLN
jgi:hypothetical protein